MKKILVISCILFLNTLLLPETFQVVFLANMEYADNPKWITQIKKWGATGVNFRIYCHTLEDRNLNFNSAEWQKISNCLKRLSDSSLNIYIRVNMFNLPRNHWTHYNKNDYQQTIDGVMYSPYYSDSIPTLNLTSSIALRDRIHFFKEVVVRLNSLPDKIKSRIKLIVPTISQDDETGLMLNRKYPPEGKGTWGWLSGYSEIEQDEFIKYLSKKYSTVDNLNKSWEANFTAINRNSINIKSYNWENIQLNYTYPNGRKDFINFLSGQLKRFIDTCASIVHTVNKNFKVGAQFGSVYDSSIEFSAFYDVTPLLENVDMVICDDIVDYYPNFNFASDYLRSICNYWNWQRKDSSRFLNFATETNWPGYNDIVPDTLVKYWKMQLQSYYDRGASTLFISHWGTIDLDVTWLPKIPPTPSDPFVHLRIGDLIINDQLTDDGPYIQSLAYLEWKKTLNDYKTFPVNKLSLAKNIIDKNKIVILNIDSNDPNSIFQLPNLGDSVNHLPTFNGKYTGYKKVFEFPLSRTIKTPHPYSFEINNEYDSKREIITDYMMTHTPDYLMKRFKISNN